MAEVLEQRIEGDEMGFLTSQYFSLVTQRFA
jgi:hypothetical protein